MKIPGAKHVYQLNGDYFCSKCKCKILEPLVIQCGEEKKIACQKCFFDDIGDVDVLDAEYRDTSGEVRPDDTDVTATPTCEDYGDVFEETYGGPVMMCDEAGVMRPAFGDYKGWQGGS